MVHLLRDEYRIREVTKAQSDTLEGLVAQMEGVHPDQFLRTIDEYNAAVQSDIPFNPTIKDGRRTEGLNVDKTNWANTLDEPPYMAFGVTCGITFTFGGVRVDRNRRRNNTGSLRGRGDGWWSVLFQLPGRDRFDVRSSFRPHRRRRSIERLM